MMMALQWGETAYLRAAAENLADAIKARVATENRAIRGGVADSLLGEEMIKEAKAHEESCRRMLQQQYLDVVPEKVRAWAASIPVLRSGELFPRMLGLIGNPMIAVPQKVAEGKLLPDGEPYERRCLCLCGQCSHARANPGGGPHCRAEGAPCHGLRELWQYCGCGDPMTAPKYLGSPVSQEQLLYAGKRTTVRPLLYTFSNAIAMGGQVVTKEGSKFFGHPRSEEIAASKYFRVFMEAKRSAASKCHQVTCRNRKRPPRKSDGCGTVMHPEWGEVGSPWRPGHVQAHAHRITQKELLRDLWLVCR